MTEKLKRAWRPRWWHWVIAFMVLVSASVIGFVVSARRQSVHLYDETIASLHARGEKIDFDDFKSMAPPVDIDRQSRYRTWLDRLDSEKLDDWPIEKTELVAWLCDSTGPPKGLSEELAKRAEMIDAGLAILREGPVIDGAFGWVEQDFPHKPTLVIAAYKLRCSSLLTAIPIAQWLQNSAYLAFDPNQALDDFDRFVATFHQPGCLIDAMVMIAMNEQRDDAYLQLVAQGRLPRSRLDRWLQEPAFALQLTVDSDHYEHMLYMPLFAEAIRRSSLWSRDIFGQPSVPGAITWMYGLSDYVALLEDHLALQKRMRDATAPMPAVRPNKVSFHSSLFLSIRPDNVDAFATALGADASHRAHRLAAKIIHQWQSDGQLPSDETAVGEHEIFAPGADSLSLRYEVIGPDHVRIFVDPKTPLPNFLDPGKPNRFPAPAMKNPAKSSRRATVYSDRSVVEIVLPNTRK